MHHFTLSALLCVLSTGMAIMVGELLMYRRRSHEQLRAVTSPLEMR